MSDSSISWAICKSAPHPRAITIPAPHHVEIMKTFNESRIAWMNSIARLNSVHLKHSLSELIMWLQVVISGHMWQTRQLITECFTGYCRSQTVWLSVWHHLHVWLLTWGLMAVSYTTTLITWQLLTMLLESHSLFSTISVYLLLLCQLQVQQQRQWRIIRHQWVLLLGFTDLQNFLHILYD